ncbi:hypothetical protein MRX96_045875 [Rhipicephalus microplus]
MPSSPPRISAAATPEGRLTVGVRMEKPSFRTRLYCGRDALISTSYSAAATPEGRLMVGGEDGEAQLPDSSVPRP